MNEVFRFLMLRPPEVGNAVEASPSQDFSRALSQVDAGENRRAALQAAANRLLASSVGLNSVAALHFGRQLAQLSDRARSWTKADFNDLETGIKLDFRQEASAIVATNQFSEDRSRLSDNLIAAKLLSRDLAVPAVVLERLLLICDLIQRAADKDPDLMARGGVTRALTRPTVIGVPQGRKDNPPPRAEVVDDPQDRLGALERKRVVLEKLVERLGRVSVESLELPPPKRLEEVQVLPDNLTQTVRAQLTKSLASGQVAELRAGLASAVVSEIRALGSVKNGDGIERATSSRLRLTTEAQAAFSGLEKEAMKQLGIDASSQRLPEMLELIGAELARVSHAALLEAEGTSMAYAKIGSSFVNMGAASLGSHGTSMAVPDTHSTIKPVGVGDLLIVRQTLKRYEGGEVAHVENILKGEFKTRAHERARETEQTTTVEVETKTEEERDTQTTERFEMQREASQVIKEDMSLKAGLSISGSYGPTIEFKASTDFAMNRAKEEASKTASKYSKEVTSRASSKVSERNRSEQILRTLEVFKERNEHGFDNKAGGGHVSGVYQWVDKVYEAQVFNYGRRMMFDVMVPEPAAFWIYANATQPAPGMTLTRPLKFDRNPSEIGAHNYMTYVQRYQVPGVKAPPEPYVTVSKTFDGTIGHDAWGSTSKIADLAIPDGYKALSGHAIASCSTWESNWQIQIAIGRGVWTRQSGSYINHYYSLNGETGTLAVGVRTFQVATFITTIEVDCQRTDRALDNWRLETHAAIQQAYLKLERDYQDELTALQVEAASNIQGRNPADNRRVERAEIKRSVVAALTAQHFDLFGAIETSPQGYPQSDLLEADAEGRYIRFFEQAFEWEQIMYLFYPYFWGRKYNWRRQALLQDIDAMFGDFLRAGSARVVLPVRPGFESAIAHFLDTGEVWEGADPPTLTSPLYVSIVQEIKERDQAPGNEVAQGDPWDVRLPTMLVKLRADDQLPEWSKQADGSWLPV